MSILLIVVTTANKIFPFLFTSLSFQISRNYSTFHQMFNIWMFLPQRWNSWRVQIFGDKWGISASSHGRLSERENFRSLSPHECWGQCLIHRRLRRLDLWKSSVWHQSLHSFTQHQLSHVRPFPASNRRKQTQSLHQPHSRAQPRNQGPDVCPGGHGHSVISAVATIVCQDGECL